jgi:hypothetical protein
MAASTKSKITTNRDDIRRWTEARNGVPAAVVRPKSAKETNLICIHFPDDQGDGAQDKISWDDWFARFETAKLALLYQEQTAGGDRSNFHQLVSRKTVDEVEEAVGGKGRSAIRKVRKKSAAPKRLASPSRSRSTTRHSPTRAGD